MPARGHLRCGRRRQRDRSRQRRLCARARERPTCTTSGLLAGSRKNLMRRGKHSFSDTPCPSCAGSVNAHSEDGEANLAQLPVAEREHHALVCRPARAWLAERRGAWAAPVMTMLWFSPQATCTTRPSAGVSDSGISTRASVCRERRSARTRTPCVRPRASGRLWCALAGTKRAQRDHELRLRLVSEDAQPELRAGKSHAHTQHTRTHAAHTHTRTHAQTHTLSRKRRGKLG